MAQLEILNKQFPRLRKRLDFGEFHPDLAGNSVDVWLNLSAEFEQRLREHEAQGDEIERREQAATATDDEDTELAALRERRAAETAAIYAEMWDCTEEEFRALIALDPVLSTWLFTRTWELVRDYRAGRTKNWISG